MSEETISLPVSESLILTGFGMLIGMVGGICSCILKSRCSTIKCCGLELQREVIPATELNSVNISTSTNN